MPTHQSALLRDLNTIFRGGSTTGLTDAELIDRFVNQTGAVAESAFSSLIDRYGSMVRHVCNSMLHDPGSVDDAFQATFLILFRKAKSIKVDRSIGPWLWSVAYKVVARERRNQSQRSNIVSKSSCNISRKPDDGIDDLGERAEFASILHDEIARLPEKYRAPIILCYWEGKTHEEIASVLGRPVGTIHTNMRRGREKLRSRLIKRGVSLSASTLAAALGSIGEARSAVSVIMTQELVQSLYHYVTGTVSTSKAIVSAAAISLASQVLTATTAVAPIQKTVAALVIVAGLVTGMLATFQEPTPSPKAKGRTIHGQTVDSAKKPIPDANIQLTLYSIGPDLSNRTFRAKSDRDGRFVLDIPQEALEVENDRRHIYAFIDAPGRSIAAIPLRNRLWMNDDSPLVVELDSVEPSTWIVHDPAGKPIAGAIVEPYMFEHHNSFSIPADIAKRFGEKTDDHGEVVLSKISRKVLKGVRVRTNMYGIQRFSADANAGAFFTKRVLRLNPAGRVIGRITGEKPEWTRKVKLTFTTNEREKLVGYGHSAAGFAEVESDDQGRFVVPALASGAIILRCEHDDHIPAWIRLPVDRVVAPDAETVLNLAYSRGVPIRGRVLAKESQKPIEGVKVLIRHGLDSNIYNSNYQQTVISDADGRFTSHALPGAVAVSVDDAPDSLRQLTYTGPIQVADRAESFEIPPILLEKTRSVTGTMIDATGNPAAGKNIIAFDSYHRNISGLSIFTDEKGRFTISNLPIDIQIAGYAVLIKHDILTDPDYQVTIAQENPLILKLKRIEVPMKMIRAWGRVLDDEGSPVADAPIVICTETTGANDIMSISLDTTSDVKTDKNGRFSWNKTVMTNTRPRYRAIAPPGEIAAVASKWFREGGPLGDLKTTRLRTLHGVVIDRNGNKIAKAIVHNRMSDAPRRSIETNANGEFTLDQVPLKRPLHLNIEAAGYPFQKIVLDQVHDNVTLQINDHTILRRRVAIGPYANPERARELADRLMKPIVDRMAEDRQFTPIYPVLEALARLHPDQTWKRCTAGEAPWNNDAVRLALVRQNGLVERKFAQAWMITDSIETREDKLLAFIILIKAEASNDRPDRLREAIPVWRTLTNLDLRVKLGNELCNLMIDSKLNLESRILIDELIALARGLDQPHQNADSLYIGHTLEQLLETWGRIDPDELLRRATKAESKVVKHKLEENAAIGLADQDPERTERLIGKPDRYWNDTVINKCCIRMSKKDIDRADRLVDKISNHVRRGFTRVRIAELIADRDRPKARILVDKAFHDFDQSVDEYAMKFEDPWCDQGVANAAALSLSIVERIDHDRIAEVVDRVESYLWRPRVAAEFMQPWSNSNRLYRMRDAALAVEIAPYDLDFARCLVNPFVKPGENPFHQIDAPKTNVFDPEEKQWDPNIIIRSIVYVDPEAGVRFVKSSPDKILRNDSFKDLARAIAVKALVESPAERTEPMNSFLFKNGDD